MTDKRAAVAFPVAFAVFVSGYWYGLLLVSDTSE